MQYIYKLHTIAMTTWCSLDGFTTEVRITKGTAIAFHSLKINQPFPTKEEAKSHGLEVAKRWIDTGKRHITGLRDAAYFLSASAQLRPVENPAERASVSVEKSKSLSSGNR